MVAIVWLSIWSLSYALMLISNSEETARFFWNIGFFAGSLFFPSWISFLVYVTDFKLINKSWTLLLYVGSIILSVLCITSGDVVFIQSQFGFSFSYGSNPMFSIIVVYFIINFLLMAFLHLSWWRAARTRHEKNQLLWFNLCTFIIAPIGFFTEYVAPVFFGFVAIPIASILVLLVSLQLAAIMSAHSSMSISVKNVSEDMFKSIPMPILILDHENFIIHLNDNAVSIWGEDSIGKNAADLFFVDKNHPDTSFFEKDFVDVAVSVEVHSIVKTYDTLLKILTNKRGDIYSKIMAFNDITDVLSALASAEEASKAKSDFLSRMSHEIRTPMNSVLGITEIQLQKNIHPPKTEEAFLRIHSSSKMLLSIINDILDLSKVEAGKMEIIPTVYETASMIVDTAQLNFMYIGNKPIEFNLTVDEKMPVYLIGDELRLKQVLTNILSNAFKYTKEGRVNLSFGIKNSDETDNIMLIITVSDTGQGMTKEQTDSLFGEFARFNLETNSKIEGSGLGLAIVRQLVNMMGGDIYVESVYGKGSTFTILLPQKKEGEGVLDAEAILSLQNLKHTQRSITEIPKLECEPMPYGSVLVVDDVETNLYVAEEALKPYKVAIETAESGFDAITKIEAGKVYDIIFMDHMMPEMDGIETTKIIRDMGYDKPIVALTANAISGSDEIFMKNGFSGFLSKPLDLQQLNKYLLELIKDKHSHNAAEITHDFEEDDYTEFYGEGKFDLKSAFLRDAKKAISILEPLLKQQELSCPKDFKSYTTQVHCLKSALFIVGKSELSKIASDLEDAGHNLNAPYIISETPQFLANLLEVIKEFET